VRSMDNAQASATKQTKPRRLMSLSGMGGR
jgi:hypothetical protein